MSIFKQVLYTRKQHQPIPDIIYSCGGSGGGYLYLPQNKLFSFSDYDQVIVELDCYYPISISTNDGRLFGLNSSTRGFNVATVTKAFYYLFSDIYWGSYSISGVLSVQTKFKFRFVFDITNSQIILTRTTYPSEAVASWTRSISTTAMNGLGATGINFAGGNPTVVYIWKNSLKIQRILNGVTTTVLDGPTAVPGTDFIVSGATPVTM